jgi:hypothetical protein
LSQKNPVSHRKTYVKLKIVVAKVKTMEKVIILEKPALTLEETILEKVKTLSPERQQQVLDFIEFLQMKVKKEEIKTPEKEISFLDAAQEFIGCVDGGPGDLATNKKYLQGVGT